MAEQTRIEWADHTFNPWIGCTKVSPACDHCYAERWGARFGVSWGSFPRRRTSAANWQKPRSWSRAAKAAGVRRRVFCASLADVFDNQVPELWREDLWHLIAECPDLDWMLLTKRPQNINKMLPSVGARYHAEHDWPWPWVWLGTTVENQTEADRRIPALLGSPAETRFLSCEPLLGPLDLWLYLDPLRVFRRHIDLVIGGGESGPGARPCDPQWARKLRDDCAGAGAAFFWKQWGDWHPDALRYTDAHTRECPPRSMRIGKKAAGRLLDGREHNEMPRGDGG